MPDKKSREMEEKESAPLKDDREEIEIDDVMVQIGDTKPYQWFVVLLVCLEELFIATQSFASVFIAAEPRHWCKDSAFSDGNVTVSRTSPVFDENVTLPHSQCEMYVDGTNATDKCTDFEFDNSIFKSSVVTEWNLVCDHAWMGASVASVFMAGRALGNLIFGFLADKYGRRCVIMIAGTLNVVVGLVTAASPTFLVFLILRFTHAIFANGKTDTTFILALEFVSSKRRVVAGCLYMCLWAVGYMAFAGIGYLIRDWRLLLIAITAPELILYVIYFWMAPESPRWLLVKGKEKEAYKVLRMFAKRNGCTFPDDKKILARTEPKTKTIIDIFKTPKIRKLTCILIYNWFTVSFMYYGISLHTGDLSGDMFLNFLVSGAVEIPALLTIIYLFNKIGRIWPYVAYQCIGSIALLLCGFIKVPWVVTLFAMIGKFFITATFTMIWVYTTEIYPTSVRSIGMTTSCMFARIAAMPASYIGILAKYDPILPPLIFGIMGISAALLVLFLPETRGVPMSQTIPECESKIRSILNDLPCIKKKHDTKGTDTKNGHAINA